MVMARMMNCKRRKRLDDNGGMKFSIPSRCDKYAPILSLPREVLREEVLSRLPIRDLCRARCVCKQWRSHISSPDFIKAHRRLNHEPSHGIIIETAGSDEFVFYYSPLSEQHHRQQPRRFVPRLRVPRGRDYQWMTQVVNGLVCLYSASRLSLFSISTGEVLDLPLPPYPTPEVHCATVVDMWLISSNAVEKVNEVPKPGAEDATNCTITRYYFGFDSLHKTYKILSISYMCHEGCPGPGDLCECPFFLVPQVLSLTGPVSSYKWRKVPHPIPSFPLEMHTLCVNGNLWWTGNKNSKICFDLTDTPEHFRTITGGEYPPVSDSFSDSYWFFHSGIPFQYGRHFAVSDGCVGQRTLRLFTHPVEEIYSEWKKCDINLPVELVRRGKSSITPVGVLPDGDVLIANDHADDSLTPVYSFTPGRNKRFSKSFKVGKFPLATASMTRQELAVAVTCVQDNLTPLCDLIGNRSHL